MNSQQGVIYAKCPLQQEGVRILEGRLRSEVAARHDALLHQAGRLREAEPALQGVTSTVGGLQGALGRVRVEIMEPYDQVQAQYRASPFSRTSRCDCQPKVAVNLKANGDNSNWQVQLYTRRVMP